MVFIQGWQNRLIRSIFIGLLICWILPAQADERLFDPFIVDWKYLDNGSDQGTVWRNEGFDDRAWSTGQAELGYGDGDEVTVVNAGPNGAHYITTYFRYSFNIPDASIYQNLNVFFILDDGAVFYINGTEAFRSNMPAGVITHATLASSDVPPVNEGGIASITIPASSLHNGINTLAVEVHQFAPTSDDISFGMAIDGTVLPQPRGPYLQILTPTSVIVKWRTPTATDSRVNFGFSAGTLNQQTTNNNVTTEHEVQLTGLSPATLYHYNVGSSTTVWSSGADHFFKTQPAVGSSTPTRLWVIGDSGRGNNNQRNVYQAYLDYAGNRYTDLWLMLGDNAYTIGTDQEYQNGFFNIYQTIMHQSVVWPTIGNHDGYSVDTPLQTGPYYDIFTLPKNAEAGGVASGTEAYYSYNYGNIHFVVLDSFDVDRSTTAAMAQWLTADLTANTADWVIAYWHHPPYSKGSHDSDDAFSDLELIEMRENLVPILEQHGVDLVLTGHSHNYERSKFVQGHYGFSNTYSDALYALDTGSGNVEGGSTAYNKAHPAVAHGGTVYAVAGVSSFADGGTLDHPIMYRSFNKLGSMVIDLDKLALSARFVGTDGKVQDAFTLQKLKGINDSDRDGDGLINTADNCALNTNTDQLDSDNDGLGNACDNNDDNDAATDGADAFPLDPTETADFDEDGIGDNADGDDDNDGVPDAVDLDPFNPVIKTERKLFLNSRFQGSRIIDKTLNK